LDKEQARAVLLRQLAAYRAQSYEALKVTIGSLDVYEVANPGAPSYQIEVQVMWEAKPDGNILVIGSIDDGGWSAFAPLTEGFILDRTGAFVGEGDEASAI
jgi:hypothetical protein